ncbi:MAG: hypothetical protein PHQ19_01820 [Candidatus Krumholzibacteria bacterium]|nr:hypothetical protein [Candidatus Krumholzibacteria bacterium]
MTTREIDDLLFGLLGRVDGDARHLGFVEPAVLIFARCIEELGPGACDQQIRPYAPSMIHALDPAVIPTLNYEVLSALPGVLDRIGAVAPDEASGHVEAIRRSARQSLERYRRLLGEAPEGAAAASPADEPPGDSAGGPAPPGVNLALVWQYARGGYDFSLGKTIRTGLDLVVAGDRSLTRSFDPLVAFSGRIREERDPFAVQLRAAVSIAEHEFRRYGVGEIRRLPREYIYRISERGHAADWLKLFTGGSAGLGFALLAMSTLDSLDLRRRKRVLRDDFVVTGEVDPEGNVREVDAGSMGPKVAAAFYSGCRTFVLPHANLEGAKLALAALEKRHPARRLELFPVARAREAYEDHRVTGTREVSPVRIAAGKIGRMRKTMAAGLAVCAVGALLGIFIPPRIAREIVTYDFDGGSIRFYNRYGYNFDRFDVPYHIRTVDNDYSVHSAKSHRLVLGDADGDTLTSELIFISVESREGRKSPHGRIHVHLFSGEGRLLRHLAGMPEVAGSDPGPAGAHRNFGYYYDIVEDVEGDGRKEVLISFADLDYSLSGIINVSLSRGDYQCFLHPGHMIRFVTGDFDRDGRIEIAAAGETSLMPSGVIAVLDPALMHGMTPQALDRAIPGFADDVAMRYIVLPVSDLRDLREGIQKPFIDTIIRDEKGRLRVGALEDSENDRGNALWYYFGPDWRCEEVEETDAYRAALALGLSGEPLDDRLEKQAARLKGEFRYYTGSGLSDTPVVNAGYLAALRKQRPAGVDSVRD